MPKIIPSPCVAYLYKTFLLRLRWQISESFYSFLNWIKSWMTSWRVWSHFLSIPIFQFRCDFQLSCWLLAWIWLIRNCPLDDGETTYIISFQLIQHPSSSPAWRWHWPLLLRVPVQCSGLLQFPTEGELFSSY